MRTREATQPAGGQESKNHKDRPTHHHKCTLSILIMTNNTRPVAFDGSLMENRGWKRKIVKRDRRQWEVVFFSEQALKLSSSTRNHLTTHATTSPHTQPPPQIHAQHIDHDSQHWPGGICQPFDGEQRLAARRETREQMRTKKRSNGETCQRVDRKAKTTKTDQTTTTNTRSAY
jgi:hypothetical protein